MCARGFENKRSGKAGKKTSPTYIDPFQQGRNVLLRERWVV
jgi:hypothetical protein